MATDWKWETAMGAIRRQTEEAQNRYYHQGLAAQGAPCPYPYTSFAAIHWRRGAADARRGDQ